MTDLDAAIRAKLTEIAAENDDDCNMQRGVSCASQGYGNVASAVLAVLTAHVAGHEEPGLGRICTGCANPANGHFVFDPCQTKRAIAEQLGIET